MAHLLKIEVQKIEIYPLGGISKFKMDLNISPKKEILILIMGPIFQQLFYLLLIKILPNKQQLINNYHYGILFFNLLPIYPLDGGKLVNILLSYIFPYKKSLKGTLWVSYLITVSLLLTKEKKGNTIIMIIFLICLITKEKRKVNYNYNKFLLERYLNNYHFSKNKIITKEENFYRNYNHLIQKNAKYYWEEEYLEKKYKKT